MRKIVLPLLSVLFLLSSCQETPDKDVVVQNSIEDMNKITGELLDFASNNLSSFVSIEKNGGAWFDHHKMTLEGLNHLDGRIIDGSNLDFQSVAAPFSKVKLENLDELSRTHQYDYSVFSMAQATVADAFINLLLEVDDLSQVGRLVRNFNIQVLNSPFTTEQKDELLMLSSTVLALGNFLLNDGLSILNQEITAVLGDPTSPTFGGRILGCSVSMRSVWISAVIGLTSGAVRGAFVGAASGTVVPGAGTVSGAVSGAVVGGAAGFVGGAVASMAGQMIETCWR